MHALDFDDMAFGGHGSSCVLGGVLARGEQDGIDGAAILVAYVAGMELFSNLERFDRAPTALTATGWHATSVRGLIGATVATAHVATDDARIAQHAILTSLVGGCATVGGFGSMVKPVHAGLVATNAVRSTELALAGLTGRTGALVGPGSFEQVYLPAGVDWGGLIGALGLVTGSAGSGPTVKCYPCCAGNQRAMAGVERLMTEAALTAADVASVELHVDPELARLLHVDWPSDRYEAKFRSG